jgi:hypothetical protein
MRAARRFKHRLVISGGVSLQRWRSSDGDQVTFKKQRL